MYDTLFTSYQMLQLVALGPCLFVMYFVCVCGKNIAQILLPVLYFSSLAASFVLPLQDTLGELPQSHLLLSLLASLEPACGFLLVVQFATDRCPPFLYWTILLVPLLGNGLMLYATFIAPEELCIWNDWCATAESFSRLYTIFSSGLMFLLILFIYQRLMPDIQGTEYQRTHKKALILALVGLNLLLPVIAFAGALDWIERDYADIAMSLVRTGFIYVVLTSIFRVFDHSLQLAYERIPTLSPSGPDARDQQLAEHIIQQLSEQKIYQNSCMNRAQMAKMFSVSEQVLSRVINQCLHQNFQTLLNHYRVEEAKERLSNEDVPITDIAFNVGFASIPSFNRVFRQATGASPSEYRKKMQG